MVALANEVLRHAHYAVCDAINVRRERLRNDRDPHAFKIAIMRSNSAKLPLHPNERSMKVNNYFIQPASAYNPSILPYLRRISQTSSRFPPARTAREELPAYRRCHVTWLMKPP